MQSAGSGGCQRGAHAQLGDLGLLYGHMLAASCTDWTLLWLISKDARPGGLSAAGRCPWMQPEARCGQRRDSLGEGIAPAESLGARAVVSQGAAAARSICRAAVGRGCGDCDAGDSRDVRADSGVLPLLRPPKNLANRAALAACTRRRCLPAWPQLLGWSERGVLRAGLQLGVVSPLKPSSSATQPLSERTVCKTSSVIPWIQGGLRASPQAVARSQKYTECVGAGIGVHSSRAEAFNEKICHSRLQSR